MGKQCWSMENKSYAFHISALCNKANISCLWYILTQRDWKSFQMFLQYKSFLWVSGIQHQPNHQKGPTEEHPALEVQPASGLCISITLQNQQISPELQEKSLAPTFSHPYLGLTQSQKWAANISTDSSHLFTTCSNFSPPVGAKEHCTVTQPHIRTVSSHRPSVWWTPLFF